MSKIKAQVQVNRLSGRHDGRSIAVKQPEVVKLASGKSAISAMPQLVTLNMRPASSAPEGTRVKFTLDMEVADGQSVSCLVAQATVLPVLPVPAFCVESRMEMN